MTLTKANIEIRKRLRTRKRSDGTFLSYRARRPLEDYPPYIETESRGPVPTEEDTNNQAQHWAERRT